MVDLWDPEKGYYLNGTYYGDKDVLALGVAAQQLAKKNAYNVDFLLEKKLGDAGTVSVQGEYAKYEFGGYTGNKSDGGFGLVSYLFPQVIGIGKFELLAKYSKTTYDFDDAEGIYLGPWARRPMLPSSATSSRSSTPASACSTTRCSSIRTISPD